MSPNGYELLDSGGGRKLERIGPHLLDRQAPQAFWSPTLDRSEWQQAVGVHVRKKTGGGFWQWRDGEPERWTVNHGGVQFGVRPTPFGHLGLFAEQVSQWDWLNETLKRETDAELKLLNLFAYTGGSTLAAAAAGAGVTHVDAARGVVDWARENQSLNDLGDAPIRWIVDDCQSFVDREIRRERAYDGIILDPPSFGRGSKGEVWKIEDHILPLLASCARLLGSNPKLIILTAHSPGFGGLALNRLLEQFFESDGIEKSWGEMTIEETSGRLLPSGCFARWRNSL